MMDKTKVLVIVGPTASGKTKLAVDIAKRYNGEVVSADSMQIYKGMSIGTAKPTVEEMDGIPHHLIDFVDPTTSFSVVDYVTCAHKVIDDIKSRDKLPIIVGGTGLYVDSLIDDVQFDETKADNKIRDQLYKFAQINGVDALFERLINIDPVAANKMHRNNIPRVVRAIEIYMKTGITMTEHQNNSKIKPSRYDDLKIGITYNDRQRLYDKINLRVDNMITQGLLDEAKQVYNSNYVGTALQAIGYKELFAYFDGQISLETALNNLKQSSRRYAKRQLTWFKRDEKINWFFLDQECLNENKLENIQFMQKKIYNTIDNFFNMCYY